MSSMLTVSLINQYEDFLLGVIKDTVKFAQLFYKKNDGTKKEIDYGHHET